MKMIGVSLSVLLLLLCLWAYDSRGEDLVRGLVAHWTFNEGEGSVARDVSGGEHHGMIMGSATWAAGRMGKALAFDGVVSRNSIVRTRCCTSVGC